jgi:hypothetical protein
VTIESLGEDGTRLAVQIEREPYSTIEKLGAAVGVDDHQVEADLERFRTFVEERPADTGAWHGHIG